MSGDATRHEGHRRHALIMHRCVDCWYEAVDRVSSEFASEYPAWANEEPAGLRYAAELAVEQVVGWQP